MKLICERTTFIPGFRVFTLHRNRSGVSRPLDPFNYLSSTDRYPERLNELRLFYLSFIDAVERPSVATLSEKLRAFGLRVAGRL